MSLAMKNKNISLGLKSFIFSILMHKFGHFSIWQYFCFAANESHILKLPDIVQSDAKIFHCIPIQIIHNFTFLGFWTTLLAAVRLLLFYHSSWRLGRLFHPSKPTAMATFISELWSNICLKMLTFWENLEKPKISVIKLVFHDFLEK